MTPVRLVNDLMSKSLPLTAFVAMAIFGNAHANFDNREMTVYKTEYCGCCDKWIDHAEANGFEAVERNVSQERLTRMKQDAGLDRRLWSCHTTLIDGYVVEGHVPAEAIRKLLAEQPDLWGISAPGMPMQSPGMTTGVTYSGFDVVAIDRSGNTSVFLTYE